MQKQPCQTLPDQIIIFESLLIAFEVWNIFLGLALSFLRTESMLHLVDKQVVPPFIWSSQLHFLSCYCCCCCWCCCRCCCCCFCCCCRSPAKLTVKVPSFASPSELGRSFAETDLMNATKKRWKRFGESQQVSMQTWKNAKSFHLQKQGPNPVKLTKQFQEFYNDKLVRSVTQISICPYIKTVKLQKIPFSVILQFCEYYGIKNRFLVLQKMLTCWKR